MSLTPSDDYLTDSFFTTLYPDAAAPAAPPAAHSPHPLEHLVEQWPDAVWCLDAQGHCWLANRAARSWLGPHNTPATPPGASPLSEWVPTALLDALLPGLAPAMRGLEHHSEVQLPHPQSGLRWWHMRIQPNHTAHGVEGLFIHLHDTTDTHEVAHQAQRQQHALQQQLATHAAEKQAHEARFRLMGEGLRDAALVFLDAQGHITDWPRSAQLLFGHTPTQALGQAAQLIEAVSDDSDTSESALLALERAALLGQCDSTGWCQRADGSRFWGHTAYTLLLDSDSGESLGYSCWVRDMTEVKRLEDLLRQINQELEVRVHERTAQLQAINQDLEAFSASVSHDLRAPLRHIGSYVSLLQEDLATNPDPSTHKYLATIAQSAEHMGQLIEGLLAFSRLGRAPLNRRVVAMGALLQSSLNRVQHDPALQRPADAVQWNLPADLPSLEADGLLISQVWDNLLANALKYSRPRSLAHISVGWQATASQETLFWVRDNGVGFDPGRADKLFGMFQRLHRARDFEGTGIGLALCRRILERHGGRIWAESTPDQGSTFYFALPVRVT